MRCAMCGAENPDDGQFCQMCGKGMYGQPSPRKSDSKLGTILVIVIIVLIVLPIVLSAFLYIMVLTPVVDGMTPVFGTSKGSNATYTIWTVASISGGGSVLKSDVYVQVRNESGTYQILTEALEACDGTSGFEYTPASAGGYISVGDTFALLKDWYKQGSTITLVTPSASSQYSVMTV